MHKKVIIPSSYSQITYQGTCSLIPRVYLFFWALMHVFHFVSLQTCSTHSTYIHVVPSNIPSYFNNVLHRLLYLWTNERTKVNKIHCTFVISFDRSRSFDTQTHSFVSWNNNPYSIHISVIIYTYLLINISSFMCVKSSTCMHHLILLPIIVTCLIIEISPVYFEPASLLCGMEYLFSVKRIRG